MKIRTLLFACIVAASPLALAGPSTPAPSSSNNKLSDVDMQIVAHLHAVDQLEIELGTLAGQNGTAAVKAYGQMLVKDHTAFDAKITAFAKQHKLTPIPADESMSAAMKADMDTEKGKLKALKGSAFDQELMPMMAKAHDDELAKADANISIATDPALKTMLEGVKPVLQRHADQARSLEQPARSSQR
jgi:predicted outer membrane protein